MSYSISTMHIFRNFNDNCVCPICKIRQIVERDIADAHLGEAVMEDTERHKVNKFGFCVKHYELLYEGRGKLGLALQLSTRLDKMISFTKVNSVKNIEKTCQKLTSLSTGCIVCEKMEFNMKRYFETIARLYGDDENFRKNYFAKINGFCYPDYIRLLSNAKYAKKYADEFISVINQKQVESLKALKCEINEFTKSFDYRTTTPPPKNVASSLKTARIKLYGDLSLPPERK